jgi:hypothetical protein
MTSWDSLQPKFRQFCLQRGTKAMQAIADQIPADVRTAERIRDGGIKKPSKAMQAAIAHMLFRQVPLSDEGTPKG